MTEVLDRVHEPVFDFDYYKDPYVTKDAHEGYMRLKREAPPLFWTERNGGHWVAVTGQAVRALYADAANLSNESFRAANRISTRSP